MAQAPHQILAELYRARATCLSIIEEAEDEGDFHDAREFTKLLESIDQQIWRNRGKVDQRGSYGGTCRTTDQ